MTMKQTKKNLLRLLTLILPFASAVASPAADLELLCRPIYAEQDFRAMRPALPPGDYRINFHDPKTGKSCESEQLIVLRQPEIDLDRVVTRLVRYRYHRAAGDLAAAGAELHQACEEAPDSLTAWYYLAAHATEIDDFELQLETVEKMRDILHERGDGKFPDSSSVRILSRGAVNSLDQIRQKAVEARAAKSKDLVGGDDSAPID
jgi:hypothetical protein